MRKKQTKKPLSIKLFPSEDLTVPRHSTLPEDFSDKEYAFILYISDLHIDYKVSKKKNKAKDYLRNRIIRLKNTIPQNPMTEKYILIVGDVSFDFELFKLFFTIYREEIMFEKTFFVMGNHELWDEKLNKKHKTIEDIVDEYRIFLKSLKRPIILLENELYLPNTNVILSEKDLLNMESSMIREKLSANGFAIFGSLGYAGLNEEYNYNSYLYRNAPMNRENEIERSLKVSNIHEKLREICSDKKIFFITHMPKKDWSDYDYVSNWVYVSGHTHKNYYCVDEKKQVYEDNQMGYDKTNFQFKFIATTTFFNIFDDYEDGIYELEREKYINFYYGIGHRIEFNREFEKLYMLKRENIYMFLLKTYNSDELKILNGGSYKNSKKNNPNYFYKNMVDYAKTVNAFLEDYQNYMKVLSKEIKSIRGSGKIHGCIIDIDFLNHIYVNPLDGKITPYYATSMTSKYFYKNIRSLLKYKCPQIYDAYIRKIEYSSNNGELMVIDEDAIESNIITFVESTEMYSTSRIMLSLQYITENNIIRLWNDGIVCDKTKEKGKMIVERIIDKNDEDKE